MSHNEGLNDVKLLLNSAIDKIIKMDKKERGVYESIINETACYEIRADEELSSIITEFESYAYYQEVISLMKYIIITRTTPTKLFSNEDFRKLRDGTKSYSISFSYDVTLNILRKALKTLGNNNPSVLKDVDVGLTDCLENSYQFDAVMNRLKLIEGDYLVGKLKNQLSKLYLEDNTDVIIFDSKIEKGYIKHWCKVNLSHK